MSYCRWSSDNWKSDIYTYAHVDGTWITHVAGRRRLNLDKLPPSPYSLLNKGLSRNDFIAAALLYHDTLDNLPFVDIELPHAGETFKDASPRACADTLRMLKGLGYHVPDGVIEELDSEETESSPSPTMTRDERNG